MDVRHNVLSDISLHDVIELKSYKGHMIDFFEFYKTFDFEDFILDIHLGQPIKKLVNGRAPVMIFGPYVSKSVLQFREKEWIRDFRMFCGKIAERLIELKRESAMKFKLRKRRFDPFRRPTSCPPPVATIKRQRQRKYFNERKKSGEIKEMRTKRENQVFWGRVLAMPILK